MEDGAESPVDYQLSLSEIKMIQMPYIPIGAHNCGSDRHVEEPGWKRLRFRYGLGTGLVGARGNTKSGMDLEDLRLDLHG